MLSFSTSSSIQEDFESTPSTINSNNCSQVYNILNVFQLRQRWSKLAAVLAVMALCFIILFALKADLSTILFFGGIIGASSSLYVMLDISLNDKDSSMRLLFWRAFSDFGIAVRFIATYGFNKFLCGKYQCATSIEESKCGFQSAFLEFFEISSEMWFACVAIDLVVSISNPFSSSTSRMRQYHVWVWLVSVAFAIPTGLLPQLFGFYFIDTEINDTAICWIKQDKEIKFSWIYIMFYFPLFIVYGFALYTLYWAYTRLSQGISSTIIHRMRALVVNAINVFIYVIYWAAMMLFLALSWFQVGSTSADNTYKVLLFLMSSKGVSAILVRILTANLSFVSKSAKNVSEIERVDLDAALRQEILFFATSGIRNCASKGSDLQRGQSKVVIKLEHRPQELLTNPSKLSVWFFLALIFGGETQRRQIVSMATEVRKKRRELTALEIAVRDDGHSIVEEDVAGEHPSESAVRLSQRATLVMGSPNEAVGSTADPRQPDAQPHLPDVRPFQSEFARPSEIVVTRVEEAETSESWISSCFGNITRFFSTQRRVVEFVEIEPYHFRRVRLTQRISDEEYCLQFKATIKERVTEGGASGAFFFFSKDERFIAKSCTEEEMGTLSTNAKKYADYFESSKGINSFISKVYGAYKMNLDDVAVHFFVMNNLFYSKDENGDPITIHEKYDLKGSTVNRSSVPPREGDTCTCKDCKQKFVYHRKKRGRRNGADQSLSFRQVSIREPEEVDLLDSKCAFTVTGVHEPNVTMKDNDLKYKFRLPKSVARELIVQLEWDADFLLSIDVMDYSLLVGVHNTEYAVRGDGTSYGPPTTPSINAAATPTTSASSPSGTSETHARKRDRTKVSFQTEISNPLAANSSFDLNSTGSLSLSEDGPRSDISFSNPVASLFRRFEVSRVVGPDSYQMGIIDYQQQWNLSKKFERFVKVHLKGEDPNGLSAIVPDIYRDRFVNHMRDILEVDIDSVETKSKDISHLNARADNMV